MDLVTTAGVTILDDWGGGTTMIPVAKAATATTKTTETATATSFLRETIHATLPAATVFRALMKHCCAIKAEETDQNH